MVAQARMVVLWIRLLQWKWLCVVFVWKKHFAVENFVNLWVISSLHKTPVGSSWEGCMLSPFSHKPFSLCQCLGTAVKHWEDVAWFVPVYGGQVGNVQQWSGEEGGLGARVETSDLNIFQRQNEHFGAIQFFSGPAPSESHLLPCLLFLGSKQKTMCACWIALLLISKTWTSLLQRDTHESIPGSQKTAAEI